MKNCHNSRTSHDIDMKLGPIIKLDKKSTESQKNNNNNNDNDDVMSANCDLIIFFPVYGQFAAIWKPHSGRMVYKTYIFKNNNLFPYKN